MIIPSGAWRACMAMAIGVFAVVLPCGGQTVTLPLAGYFHPGRAMPVQWVSPTAKGNAAIELSAAGALGVQVQIADAAEGVFPWLTINGQIHDLRCNCRLEFPALHPLAEDERLIGSTLDDDALAGKLFPAGRIVPIHFQGPAMAWETLDVLLLTPSGFAKIPASMREELYAAGIELAVVGQAVSAGDWPWRHEGRVWIASSGLALPETIDADAYDPALGWTAGRSAGFRRRIVLLAVVFCLAACGVGLWRSRWMPVAIVVLGLVSAPALAWDNRRQNPVAEATGMIRIAQTPPSLDTWLYQSCHRDADFRLPVAGLIQPVFSDDGQAAVSDVVLHCDQRGTPIAIGGRLKADWPLALLRRQISHGAAPAASHVVTSPMRLLARDSIYAGFSIAGQAAAEPPATDAALRWPTVILAPQP